jgi:hypothetical protein
MPLLPYKMAKQAEMIIRKYQGEAKNSPQMPIDIRQNNPILASFTSLTYFYY